MNQLDAMRVFVAVVENHGFTAAARALRMPLPTVCRKVAELEDHIGAQLLTRSTRKVLVTDSGERYFDDAKRILEGVDDADRQASGEFQRIKGLLSITAPSLFGRLHVLPIVNEFIKHHSEIEVKLLFTNQIMELPENHVDLGFRIGALTGSSIDVLSLGVVRQLVCASPTYLSAHRKPLVPKDILKHQCITFSRSGNTVPWTFENPAGRTIHITPKSRLLLNSAESAVDSALQDCGLTQLYSYQAAPHIAEGELGIILEQYEVTPTPVSLILSHDQRIPQKIKAFTDFAVPILRESLRGISQLCDVEPK